MPRWSPKPTVELAAPAELLQSIGERFHMLRNEGPTHPVFKMSPKQWKHAIKKQLLVVMRSGGFARDAALIELCRLDPRFLGTELMIATILDWKLRIIWHDIRLPHQKGNRPPGINALAAEWALNRLAQAVWFTSGRGQRGYRLRTHVKQAFARCRSVFAEIRKQLRATYTQRRVRELAEQFGLSQDLVRDLKGARQLEGKVDEYLGREYGLSPSRVRALRS